MISGSGGGIARNFSEGSNAEVEEVGAFQFSMPYHDKHNLSQINTSLFIKTVIGEKLLFSASRTLFKIILSFFIERQFFAEI